MFSGAIAASFCGSRRVAVLRLGSRPCVLNWSDIAGGPRRATSKLSASNLPSKPPLQVPASTT